MATEEITRDHLFEIMDYDPTSGNLIWKKKIASKVVVGSVAGGKKSQTNGRLGVRIYGKHYLAHRLVWLINYGEWPKLEISHINGDKSDNRLENLKLATHQENARKWPRQELTHDHLLEILDYNKDTGIFTWRVKTNGLTNVGDRAGGERVNSNGMLSLCIYERSYRAHRLAWFYIFGRWPTKDVFHINGDRTDNRIENLKEVDHRDTMRVWEKHELTHDHLLEILDYNKCTGVFTWKKGMNPQTKIGDIAGRSKPGSCGYLEIVIYGKRYLSHRLAWFYVNETWPKYEIDHINHVRSDNRIENLRDVPKSANQQNRSFKKNASGVCGVYLDKQSNKWRAGITVNKKYISLGAFSDINKAAIARKEAERDYDFHENHGKDLIAA